MGPYDEINSPEMDLCRAEIREVLQRHDMMGAVFIGCREGGAWTYTFETTWSVVTDHPDGFRFRSKREDFASKEAQDRDTTLTLQVMDALRMSLLHTAMDFSNNLDQIMERAGVKIGRPQKPQAPPPGQKRRPGPLDGPIQPGGNP